MGQAQYVTEGDGDKLLMPWMRSIIPTAHYSDNPLLRQPITPTAHFSRQCKIELNPLIHDLTMCIQQDVTEMKNGQ